ncbi:hypothetical protein PIB30_085864 [Stylosanthes scabra]|uniref:Uncharacterized protein n=1 Tax=Stylosanthes scabra TaxID=79078 RepID=A0ABU6SUC7_9FABA|nr:hypothetical protein [Stylosanthes scabra]
MEMRIVSIYAFNLRMLNKSARWETTHRDGTHKVKPSAQREDKSVQTSYASRKQSHVKARIIKVLRNSATPVSSTSCPSRKQSHVNPPAKETPNLSNGGGRLLQGSDSEHEKDKNLEAGTEDALLAPEDGVEETLLKNDVYAALWAMLDAESENEAEIPGQWDLDGVLKMIKDPHPQQTKHYTTFHLHRGLCNFQENGEKKQKDLESLKRKKTKSKRAHLGYHIVTFEPRSQRGPNMTHSSSS